MRRIKLVLSLFTFMNLLLAQPETTTNPGPPNPLLCTLACPRLESRTEKKPNRTRHTLGIGEEVKIIIKNLCGATVMWEITGNGVLIPSPNNQNTVSFQALWTPGEIRIIAHLTGLCQDCGGPNLNLEKVFDVIAPNDVYFDNNTYDVNFPQNIFHLKNRVSVGYFCDSYLMPPTVNFYNVRIKEGEAEGKYIGEYFNMPPVKHLANEYVKFTDIVFPGKGTLITIPDRVRLIHNCRNSISPVLYGKLTYVIPNYYENPKGGPSDKDKDVFLCYIEQSGENAGGTENSRYTLRKRNSENSKKVEDRTSLWPGVPSIYDSEICE